METESQKSEPPGSRSNGHTATELRKHIRDLTSENFQTRSDSITGLEKFGESGAEALVETLLKKPLSHGLLRGFEEAFEEIEVDAPLVGIIMGSKNDKPKLQPAGEALHEHGISYEVRVLSAHRQPDETADYCANARMRGLKVIIAGAGMSAALPGFAATVVRRPPTGAATEEAVLLSDRVIVLSGRPGTVVHQEQIPLSRPRGEEFRRQTEFIETVQKLRSMLGDPALVLTVIALTAFGIAMIYSAGQLEVRDRAAEHAWRAQLMWLGISLVVLFVVMHVPVRWLEWLALPLYVFSLLVLVVTLAIGTGAGTAASVKGWLRFGGFAVQPAQFALTQVVLDFAPGAYIPSHVHGGPGLVTVTQGEIEFRTLRETVRRTAGGVFLDVEHAHDARNVGSGTATVIDLPLIQTIPVS